MVCEKTHLPLQTSPNYGRYLNRRPRSVLLLSPSSRCADVKLFDEATNRRCRNPNRHHLSSINGFFCTDNQNHTPIPFDESSLDDSGVRVTPEDVEEVLKLSYSHPATAVKFFRWSGHRIGHRHSPYSWNLMVDLLGKNLLFDAMWDSVKSMRNERLLSLATFASVFGSYVSAGRTGEAILTFDQMVHYGIPRDVTALNSLLSAICRDGRTVDAKALFDRAKAEIRPDADTYAILLEGWENEVDAGNGRRTFLMLLVFVIFFLLLILAVK
ncbi:Pentatricopeptide repeat-containing protein [Acorus gramineus]|uniref:Pentatricopeptide repeat-containing protein n=1 Tax=Acorus gramineus TaxID=55184 RepID=A0AAV9AD42_ACOGR|nr:Pentatricopeptide repeat-containing protein [Acorus gramineus]